MNEEGTVTPILQMGKRLGTLHNWLKSLGLRRMKVGNGNPSSSAYRVPVPDLQIPRPTRETGISGAEMDGRRESLLG